MVFVSDLGAGHKSLFASHEVKTSKQNARNLRVYEDESRPGAWAAAFLIVSGHWVGFGRLVGSGASALAHACESFEPRSLAARARPCALVACRDLCISPAVGGWGRIPARDSAPRSEPPRPGSEPPPPRSKRTRQRGQTAPSRP